jgi:inorganic pyrophosphatase
MKTSVITDNITVVVETPKGSAEKYAYDGGTGFFLMKKILPSGMVFPYDFGFIAGTKGEDGDPLDIIVFSEFHSFPGVSMKCRILGAIKARQGRRGKKKTENDRYIGIPVVSVVYRDLTNWKKVPLKLIEELEDFFSNYNKVEKKVFKVLGFVNAKKALKRIKSHTT